MTIQRTLLISYLLISLVSALLIALLNFSHFRNTLRQEIEHKLESQAITIMQQIDTALFERIKNMSSWSHLDVMQEVKTTDVDKRLSQFLRELSVDYNGVYKNIFAVNKFNKVISSSNPSYIGALLRAKPPWLTTKVEEHTFTFDHLDTANKLNISVSIFDIFQGSQLGRLYASFNWQEIIRLLDSSISGKLIDSVYFSLLIDSKGRVIATSSNLQSIIPKLHLLDKSLLQEDKSGALEQYVPFLNKEVLIGYSRSKGYRAFTGLDWRILIIQSSELAFAPILNMWYMILLFFVLTLILASLISFWMSAKISKPITELAKSTHNFMLGKVTQIKPIKASSEITALNVQFAEMISSLEQSKLDIARVAKLAVIGEMAASMAHEVRTPLGILRSSAQILQREPQLSEIGLEMTEFIVSETTRLNELVTIMLECARPRPPKYSAHDIQKIIEHVIDLLKTKVESKQINLELGLLDEKIEIFCDKDQLIQVFLNLIMNAIQHVQKKGIIMLRILTAQNFINITVCDNGSGIPDTQKQAVFDPFYTQRKEGIGLGLTVVQQIILAHHGKIFVTDSSYGGACFHIHLPIKNQE